MQNKSFSVLQTIGGFGAKSGGTSTCTYDLLSAVYGLDAEFKVELLTPDVTVANDKIMGNGEEWIKVVPNDYRTPLAISRNMVKFLEDSDYDIYHTNGMWMHINHITCAIARSKKKPYVITPHGMLYPQTLSRSTWKKWPMRKIWFDKDIMNASCIHATCVDEMKHLRTFGYKGPVSLIGNPVSVPDYTQKLIDDRSYKDCDVIKIGFLGRLHPRKQVERIIYGLSQSQRTDVHVYVMGKGDDSYEEFLKAESLRLCVEDSVHFLGFLTGKAKFEQLARLDALFVPSDMENFGMIIPEALIVGTPVMASLGTPWEALNKEQCGWWRDNSPESLAEVINMIAESSPEELKQMGTRGREYVLSMFAAEEVARQMVDLYKWLNGEIEKPEFVFLD